MSACDVLYRELHTNDEFAQVFKLEMLIWDMTPADCVTTYILNAVVHNGGMLIGAESDGQLVGFAFAFPARRDQEWYLWSHMAGVAPDCQGQGIGFGLKQAQRTWALEHGYDRIRWTFDPLQRPNANFNFCHLGVTANAYHVNLYGTMTDGINAGLDSDRFEVTWDLRAPHVVSLAAGKQPLPPPDLPPEEYFLLRREAADLKASMSELPAAGELYVEIPYSISSLKRDNPDLARAWQLELRRIMLAGLQGGYHAAGFSTLDERCWYTLRRT